MPHTHPPGRWPGAPTLEPPTDLGMMLGRLLERTDHLIRRQEDMSDLQVRHSAETHDRLEEIGLRLAAGDHTTQRLDERLGAIEAAAGKPKEPASGLIKPWLPYLVPLGVLVLTGSVESAAKFAAALAGAK